MQTGASATDSHAASTDTLVSSLIRLLGEEQRHLEQFRDLLHDEQQAIKALAMPRLTALTARKLTLLTALGELERARADITGRLAVAWGVHPEALTLRGIASRMEGGQAGSLLRHQDALSRLLAEVQDGNAFNGSLIAGSLACFQHSLAAWQPSPEPALYSEQGVLQAAAGAASLVERQG
jgi:flagellar biosynthesis/type III secretory pathway chaperone